MVGPFNFDQDESNRLPDAIPYHTPCGLPVELCACPDARVKFRDGMFVDMDRIPDKEQQ